VLSGLLIGAGAGSLLSSRLTIGASRWALAALLALVAFAAFGLPPVLGATLGAGVAVRIGLALAFLLVLGLAAGVPFPLGVRLLGSAGAGWIPWMWAVNGAFSVLASVLAILLAMTWGFGAPLLAALAAYGAAAFLASRPGAFDGAGAPASAGEPAAAGVSSRSA
jgi:hypothetical protein